jgi:hypothetical protein
MKPDRWICLLLCVGLFAAILGMKAVVIRRFGTDLPFWDQWAREGEMTVAPAREGTLRWTALLVPHSEHRIVPTLALNLGLAQWSGQWDARVECMVNAMLHAGFMVLLCGYVFRVYSPRAALATAWIQLGLTAAALDWENTLGGFQSQFYFLMGFSLVALWGLLDPPGPKSLRWWMGLLSGGLAAISMGSGLLCFVPAAGIAAIRLLTKPAGRLSSAMTIGACALAVWAGWLTRGIAPWDDALYAKTPADYFAYFLHCLGWLAPGWPVLASAIWLPWLVFALLRLARATARQELLLAIGLWVLLQIGAVSYYRGAGGGYPAVRYADIFFLGVLVNFLACFEWGSAGAPRFGSARASALLLWLILVTVGAVTAGASAWRDSLPSIAGRSRVYEQNVALYLKTGNAAQLQPPNLVPFPYADWLKRMLDRPSLRAALPVSVRPGAPESFASAWARRGAAAGGGLAAAGLLMLLGASALTCRRTE